MRDCQLKFQRTTCACARCVACCKDHGGSLAPGDLERIQAHLGLTRDEAKLKFWKSKGALVLDLRTMQTRRVGSIVPRMRGGRCVFLNAQDRCEIHAVAPFGCAMFDVHQTPTEYQPRSQWLVVQQDTPEYQVVRAELDDAPADYVGGAIRQHVQN